MKSKLLVFIQFFVIFLMLLPLGSVPYTPIYGLTLLGIGLFVGALALSKNRLGNFNIRPDIKKDCQLVTTGIYSFIRHPMYTSVLLCMLSVVLLYPMPYEYGLFGILLLTLLIKLFYEESLWIYESKEYREYSKKTKRLIPYLF